MKRDGRDRTIRILSALAHPSRLVIVECLGRGERNVSGLLQCRELRTCSQSNLSQHLSVLRNAGVVTARREGHQVWYRLANPRLVRWVQTGVHLGQ